MMHSRFRRLLFCRLATLSFFLPGVFSVVWTGAQEPVASRSVGEQEIADPVAKEILDTLRIQADCWNDGDIEGFMETYWKSGEMTFSSGGTTHVGWQAALDRYRKNYPREKMGKLQFEAGPLTVLADDAALLLGKYSLNREGEISAGNFSLVLRRLPEGWRIIHDHSSSLEKEESAAKGGQPDVEGPLAGVASGNPDRPGGV